MDKVINIEEALKRIEELEKENAELWEELEYYKNRKLSGRQKHNAKWMSDEATCVFIEHAHSVVDITRMPGWVSDHCVVPSHTKGETNEKKTVGALQTPTVFCHAKVKIKQLQSLMHFTDHSISKLRSFGGIDIIRKFRINGGSSRAIVQAKGICLNVIRCLVVSIFCNTV